MNKFEKLTKTFSLDRVTVECYDSNATSQPKLNKDEQSIFKLDGCVYFSESTSWGQSLNQIAISNKYLDKFARENEGDTKDLLKIVYREIEKACKVKPSDSSEAGNQKDKPAKENKPKAVVDLDKVKPSDETLSDTDIIAKIEKFKSEFSTNAFHKILRL